MEIGGQIPLREFNNGKEKTEFANQINSDLKRELNNTILPIIGKPRFNKLAIFSSDHGELVGSVPVYADNSDRISALVLAVKNGKSINYRFLERGKLFKYNWKRKSNLTPSIFAIANLFVVHDRYLFGTEISDFKDIIGREKSDTSIKSGINVNKDQSVKHGEWIEVNSCYPDEIYTDGETYYNWESATCITSWIWVESESIGETVFPDGMSGGVGGGGGSFNTSNTPLFAIGDDGPNYVPNMWDNFDIQQQSPPSVSSFLENYPLTDGIEMSASDVWELVGGDILEMALQNNWSNAYATRVSHALHNAGIIIPEFPGHTFKGSNGKNYIVNAKTMAEFLKKNIW